MHLVHEEAAQNVKQLCHFPLSLVCHMLDDGATSCSATTNDVMVVAVELDDHGAMQLTC